MNMEIVHANNIPEAKHVDVLTSNRTGRVIGYRLQGNRSGPNILVAGHSPIADEIYDRLMNIPTLPWLRGSITMIILEALDETDPTDPVFYGADEHIDELLFLPYVTYSSNAAKDGYWTVLRLCARLGMIDGRGVARI